jgi:transcriptional regulator with XRE-family HTH domain
LSRDETARDLYAFIASHIAELRSAANLTQAQLARKLNKPTNTVSRWETNTYKPNAKDLTQLARLFQVPISAFFPPDLQPQPAGEQVQALLSALGDLPPEDIQELTDYAEFRRARHLMASAKGKKPGK